MWITETLLALQQVCDKKFTKVLLVPDSVGLARHIINSHNHTISVIIGANVLAPPYIIPNVCPGKSFTLFVA